MTTPLPIPAPDPLPLPGGPDDRPLDWHGDPPPAALVRLHCAFATLDAGDVQSMGRCRRAAMPYLRLLASMDVDGDAALARLRIIAAAWLGDADVALRLSLDARLRRWVDAVYRRT